MLFLCNYTEWECRMSLRKWNNGPNRLHWPVWPIWPVILFPMWHSVSPPGMFYLISAIHCSMQITTDWRPLSLSSFLFLPRDWCLPCPSAELPWEPFPLLFCQRSLAPFTHIRDMRQTGQVQGKTISEVWRRPKKWTWERDRHGHYHALSEAVIKEVLSHCLTSSKHFELWCLRFGVHDFFPSSAVHHNISIDLPRAKITWCQIKSSGWMHCIRFFSSCPRLLAQRSLFAQSKSREMLWCAADDGKMSRTPNLRQHNSKRLELARRRDETSFVASEWVPVGI